MRQIEDKWKIDPRDPPNIVENYKNIVGSASLSVNNEADVLNFRNHYLKNTVFKTCTKTCLTKEKDYKTCFDVCSYKFTASVDLFNDTANHFFEKFDACQITGKNYFQTQ